VGGGAGADWGGAGGGAGGRGGGEGRRRGGGGRGWGEGSVRGTPARVGAERGDRAGCEGSAVVEGARLGSREVQIGAIGAVSRREIELRMHERAARAVTERRAPLGRSVFRRVGRSDPVPSSSWVDRAGDRGGRGAE